MPSMISPYALLCASKPQPAPTITTPYDLYSMAHLSSHDAAFPSNSTSVSAEELPPISKPVHTNSTYVPPHRTHYLADIHARHTAACMKISTKRN